MLKLEAKLSVLKSYVDCEHSALTSKIDIFFYSIKSVLSDLQNKEHENSQIEVPKKNTTLQNEIKSKGTVIESLFEKQKTLTKSLSDQILKPFQSKRKSQLTTTAIASAPLSTPSPTPATISAKFRTETLATVSRK